MWTVSRPAQRPARSGSVHSVASTHSLSRTSSVSSQRRATGYESDQSSDTANDEEQQIQGLNFPMAPALRSVPMWNAAQQARPNVPRLSQKFAHPPVAEIPSPAPPSMPHHENHHLTPSHDDDTHSRGSTLAGEDEPDFEFPQKTPTAPKRHDIKLDHEDGKPAGFEEKPHIPGPLEQQLHSLMSKLIYLERANPTIAVSPEEYHALQTRVKQLEAEKKTWQTRHEALFALRDEDVENNIKIRSLLAKERREHDALKKLRDEDLQNVLIVRSKLAEANRKIDRLEAAQLFSSAPSAPRAPSPSSSRSSGRPASFLERRGTSMDLFAVAKTAALEQRALELEKRNEDLLQQIEMLKGTAGVDDLNRMMAHKAWKDTVSELEGRLRAKDAEIVRLKSGNQSSSVSSSAAGAETGTGHGNGAALGNADWHRLESLHEEHARFRERMAQRVQALRSEKEGLLRELNRKEDECHDLEARVEKLQRRISLL